MRGDWAISIQWACRIILLDEPPTTKSRRSGQAVLEQRIKEICQTRVRYSYRRVHVLSRREGWPIYYEEELGRRSAAKLLTRHDAWRIAANIAKLPELLRP
jgi:putative transposase